MKSLTIPPLVLACCTSKEWNSRCRYDLASPWHEGGWIYATDGRIIVRVPVLQHGINPADFTPKGRAPEAAPLFEAGPWSDHETPIPDPGEPEWEHCPMCGDGHWCVPCTEEHDGPGVCPICGDEFAIPGAEDDDRAFRCGYCDGESPWEIYKPLIVGCVPGSPDDQPWRISSMYARLLLAHGVRAIRLPAAADRPAAFRLGDIEGLIMGMTSQ